MAFNFPPRDEFCRCCRILKSISKQIPIWSGITGYCKHQDVTETPIPITLKNDKICRDRCRLHGNKRKFWQWLARKEIFAMRLHAKTFWKERATFETSCRFETQHLWTLILHVQKMNERKWTLWQLYCSYMNLCRHPHAKQNKRWHINIQLSLFQHT